MATARTYTIQETCQPNTGSEPYDTWYGAELQYAPNGTEQGAHCVGGFFSIHGDTTGVAVQGDGGAYDSAQWFGDPGYYVHIIQAVGNTGFKVLITMEYETP